MMDGFDDPKFERAEREHHERRAGIDDHDDGVEEVIGKTYLCVEGLHGEEAETFDEAKKNFVEYLRRKADEIETLCIGDADSKGLFHLDCGLIVAMGDA
jgi:hypothetical protein